MELDALPEHLVIVGGGYIGLEFAQMFRRFGSEVTLIDRGDRLIKRESEDVSAAVAAILEGEGVQLRLGAECLGFERRGKAVAATLECRDQEPEVVGSHLLLAVGRRPNTDDLGLDTTGIEVDGRGHIRVDDALQTSVPGVWALGECNGRGAFTHTAYHDYEIVAGNLLHGDPRRVTDRIDCYALYIDPPLGRVGMTEPQVRASGRPALIATRPMTRVGRAVEKSETQGFMKVLVDAETERILGAAILGVGGDEIIHSILDVMYADAPYTVIRRAVHIHPTVAELIPTMLPTSSRWSRPGSPHHDPRGPGSARAGLVNRQAAQRPTAGADCSPGTGQVRRLPNDRAVPPGRTVVLRLRVREERPRQSSSGRAQGVPATGGALERDDDGGGVR